MRSHVKTCVLIFVGLSILTGVIYPALITLLAQSIFPEQANGSLIRKDGTVVGSKLIGQHFEDPRYFWGRLSATAPPYNAAASSGSNLGSSNPILKERATARLKELQEVDPDNAERVPVDLVTASGSGLDPHISIAAANYQKRRVARLRGISEAQLEALIRRFTTSRFIGLLGEPVVNVLQLNLALDELTRKE